MNGQLDSAVYPSSKTKILNLNECVMSSRADMTTIGQIHVGYNFRIKQSKSGNQDHIEVNSQPKSWRPV